MRKIALGFVLMGLLCMGVPVQAGGWAVLTLDAWPAQVTANKPFTIGFTLRQHGVTLMAGQAGTVYFEKDRERLQFPVNETRETGYYTATIMLPQAGTWQWRIAIFTGEHEMPALTVQDAATIAVTARPLTPAQQIALGKTLFVAKGCASCHAHDDVAGSGMFSDAHSVNGAPNLTHRALDLTYLRTWLKNPKAVKPATLMPNLNLKDDEINALAIFLGATTNAQKYIEFFSESGRFSVEMPVTQIWTTMRRKADLEGNTLQCEKLFARDNGTYFSVEYCEFPQAKSGSGRSVTNFDVLAWGRDEALRLSNSRAMTVTTIPSQGGFGDGVQVIARSDARSPGSFDGTFWARVFLNGHGVYIVSSYVFNENWGDRRAWVMPFLDSFRILPAK